MHGAISKEEFKNLLDIILYFLKERKTKVINKEEYNKIANDLYIEKVDKRINEFKNHERFFVIAGHIKTSTKYETIDEIVNLYKKIYNKIEKFISKNFISVIGHGDLCFSNMLYNKDTASLK